MNNTKTKSKLIKGYGEYEILEELGRFFDWVLIKKAKLTVVNIAYSEIDSLEEFCTVEIGKIDADEIVIENNPIVVSEGDYSMSPIGKVISIRMFKKKIRMKIQIDKHFLEERYRKADMITMEYDFADMLPPFHKLADGAEIKLPNGEIMIYKKGMKVEFSVEKYRGI